jgi:hypothetical protein
MYTLFLPIFRSPIRVTSTELAQAFRHAFLFVFLLPLGCPCILLADRQLGRLNLVTELVMASLIFVGVSFGHGARRTGKVATSWARWMSSLGIYNYLIDHLLQCFSFSTYPPHLLRYLYIFHQICFRVLSSPFDMPTLDPPAFQCL